MKLGQIFKKMVGGSMILTALACPVFTSCYDDAPLWEKVEDLDTRLTALETKLNADLAALQTLLEGKINALSGNVDALAGEVDALVTVTECEEQKDGSVIVTLSDGTVFTVYPEYEADHTGLVTTTEINGVLYWAVYDKDGKAVVVTDAKGNPVPVVDVVPQVKIDAETGLVNLTFDGGTTWIEVGTESYYVFSNAEVVYTDNYTDEEEAENPEYCAETPVYVVLTLPTGETITVTVDGAAAFSFGSAYGGAISTQYIACGTTTAISVNAVNISDWVKEVPAGWQVVEDTQYLADYGQAEFHVTAPSAEAIASGAAVAEGTMKVLAVAEGGQSITASVKLTTKAFNSFAAGKGALNVEMNYGLGGYLVGISTVDAYDPEAIVAELKPIVEYVPDPNDWMDYGWSPWYVTENSTDLDDNYFDGTVTEYPIADLAHAENLVEGESYIVWALPLNSWFDAATYNSGYTLGSIVSTEYFNAFINLDETATVVKFNDIQIKAEFKGVTTFYGAFSMRYADELNKEGILSEFNSSLTSMWGAPMPIMVNDEYVEGWNNGVYTGNPNDLVSGWQTIEPGTSYYMYLIPAVEGKEKYTMADVYFYEWETPALTAGGAIKVTAGEATLEHKKISVPLTAEGAVYIYYKYVETDKLTTIEDKAAYLVENGYRVEGGAATANQANLAPSTTRTLLAIAVDKDGKYGEVFQQDYTTAAMTYAEAVVKAELVGTPAQTGTVKISCDSDQVSEYYYWYGTADAWQWTNASYFGGSAESASAFIALTSSSYLLTKVAAADLPADGVALEDLTVGSPSVFVVSAKLADGTFTKATLVEFTPAMDLGNFVYATDENGAENAAWTAAKPTVTYEVSSVGDFSHVTWSVDVPEGFTAKTACVHEDYLVDYPSAKNKVEFFLTYPYIDLYDVVEGETYENAYASKGCNIYTVICDAEGNYYETYVEKLDISGGFGV